MIQIENDCVGCDLPCTNCGRKQTKHYYCDECESEYEKIYEYCGDQLCIHCVEKRLEKNVYCERCGWECDNLYEYNGETLCIDCIEKCLMEVE